MKQIFCFVSKSFIYLYRSKGEISISKKATSNTLFISNIQKLHLFGGDVVSTAQPIWNIMFCFDINVSNDGENESIKLMDEKECSVVAVQTVR